MMTIVRAEKTSAEPGKLLVRVKICKPVIPTPSWTCPLFQPVFQGRNLFQLVATFNAHINFINFINFVNFINFIPHYVQKKLERIKNQ